MSAAEHLRLGVSSLLSRGLSASRVAREAGLAAASEVWGGDAPRDLPAWYVWLRGAAGAWQLELAAAEPLRLAGVEGHAGTFVVRYFPPREAPELRGFSREERAFAATGLDATGTPRIDAASAMPAGLFAIGAIEWAIDPASRASVLTLSALDRARTRSAPREGAGGALARDVPAWSLGLPLFTALAGVHAQVDRVTATRLVVTSQPGFEVVEGGGRCEAREAPGTRHGVAHLVLTAAGRPAAGDALLDAVRDRSAETLLDRRLDGCGPAPAPSRGPFALAVSETWFGGSVPVADRHACGC